jgi:hypothetical protein
MVSFTPWPLIPPPEREPTIPIGSGAGWAPTVYDYLFLIFCLTLYNFVSVLFSISFFSAAVIFGFQFSPLVISISHPRSGGMHTHDNLGTIA